jgi:hypothetical protein
MKSAVLKIFLFILCPTLGHAQFVIEGWNVDIEKIVGATRYYKESPCKKKGEEECLPKYSQGLGYRIVQVNDRYLVGSYHTWLSSSIEQKMNIYGEVCILDGKTACTVLPEPMSNAKKPFKGYGEGQIAFIGDINKDGIDDYALGVPYVLSPEVHIMVSSADGSYHQKKVIRSPQKEIRAPKSFTSEQLEEFYKASNFFGQSLLAVKRGNAYRLIVSAPSYKEGQAYIYDAKTFKLLAETKSSDVKMKDDDGKRVMNRNGYEIHRIYDLDGDKMDDFVLAPSFQDTKGSDVVEVSALLHVYSSATGEKLISINSKTRNYGSASSLEVLDDLNGDDVEELAIGFKNAAIRKEGAPTKWNAGRVVIIDGSTFKEKLKIKSKKRTASLDDEELVLKTYEGDQLTLLMGAQIKRMWDIDGDGIDEFVISQPGYHLNEKQMYVGRVLIYNGATMDFLSTTSPVHPAGNAADEFMGSQIGVDRINHTMLISAPSYTDSEVTGSSESKQGALYFYRWEKSDPAVQE